MEAITQAVLEDLVEYQKLEMEIEDLKEEARAIPSRIEEISAGMEKAAEILSAAESRLKELKKNYRDYEGQIQTQQARIEKREAQLRSVKTNKEYKAMLEEIEDIRQKISGLEDLCLECLDAIDSAEQELGIARQRAKEIEKNTEKEKQKLLATLREKEKAVSELESRLSKVAEGIPANVMELYKSIRARVGDAAVVMVSESICSGCNLNIPPQMYNELQTSGSVDFCPHCQRLVYALS